MKSFSEARAGVGTRKRSVATTPPTRAISYLNAYAPDLPSLAGMRSGDPETASAAIKVSAALRAGYGRGLVLRGDSWLTEHMCLALAAAAFKIDRVARMDCEWSVPGTGTIKRHVQRWEGLLRPAFVDAHALCVLSLHAVHGEPDPVQLAAVTGVLAERKRAGLVTFVTSAVSPFLPEVDDLREIFI